MMLTISTRFSFSFFFLRGLYIILLLFQGFNHAKTKTINFNHFEVYYFYKSIVKNNILILFFFNYRRRSNNIITWLYLSLTITPRSVSNNYCPKHFGG